MAKDKIMDAMARQQQKWEKKKEKMEKRSQTSRGGLRQSEKELKRSQKEQKEGLTKEEKASRLERNAQRKVQLLRAAVLALYALGTAALLRCVPADLKEGGAGGGAGAGGVLRLLLLLLLHPLGFTGLLFLLLLGLWVCGDLWKERLVRAEQQQEAAGLIRGQLERKQQDREREERCLQRRQQQQQATRERLKCIAEEEAAALLRARELALALRRRREELQAEEARQRQQLARAEVHCVGLEEGTGAAAGGWSEAERSALREALARYPEGWSHSRRLRWERIAAEVGRGHDARACETEATRVRLEAESRSAAKAQARTQAQASADADAAPATTVGDGKDLLDWMSEAFHLGGCEDGGRQTHGHRELEEESEEEEAEEEEEEEGSWACRERMAVELEPEHKGTEIRLEGIKALQGCASVQVELLHLQLTCAECRTSTSLFLSGADVDGADAKTWCEGCTSLLSVRLRPTLLHQASQRLCYVDCVRCCITDVLPSVLMSVCSSCNADNVHKQEFLRNRIIEGTCFQCHSKYAFGAEATRIDQITPCEKGFASQRRPAQSSKTSSDDPTDDIAEELRWLRKKAKSDPRQQLIQLGKPLPQMGACSHFKKSYKWYRFPCCGRAFPCPECHLESGCPAAGLGTHASRMICGKCSMEQSYSAARPCEKCGFSMMAKGSTHWEDGSGTRNLTAMSSKDAKKFKGGLRQANSKAKTSSAKADRVGAKAKAKREHAKIFGQQN